MIQILQRSLVITTLVFIFSTSIGVGPTFAVENPNQNIISSGARATEKAAFGKETTSATGVSKIVGRIVNASLALLGTIFIVLLVYAGYKWMMAGGNEEEITKAKSIIWQAIIGLIIITAAYIITNFVVEALKYAVKEEA